MLQRSSTTLILVLLAACQATSPPDEAHQAWRWQIEATQAELQTQIASLGPLLAVRVTGSGWTQASGTIAVPPAFESAASTELIARLAILSERVDQLNASLSKANGPQPVNAAHSSDRVPCSDAAALETLQQGLHVLERQHALLVENIANVNVHGYKRRMMVATSELHEESGLRVPKAGRIELSMEVGTLVITERSFDVAIDGGGLFVVCDQNGNERYTRRGNLQMNAEGHLVTAHGAVLTPIITLPKDTLQISIDPEGRVSGRTVSTPTSSTSFGQLQLAYFMDPGRLQPTRDGLLMAGDETGATFHGAPGTHGLGHFRQGFIELSNVQITRELIRLQRVERQLVAVRRVLAAHGVYTR
ncbi:MAG: flagellar basal-body rod protein FlgG [Planctomycetota bacterium]|jgi:flagellar basal-body rod protein FlgG